MVKCRGPRTRRWSSLSPRAVLAGVALLSGCHSDSARAPTSATDSAGVRIVESTEPVWGATAPWEVIRNPLLDLTATGRGPEYEFFRVTDAVWLSDGRLVVANDGTSEIRLYSARGEYQAAAGRNGEGPGEFRRIRTMSRMRGDSVAVYDVLLNRLTILGPDGSVGRVISLRETFRRARHLRAFDDSTFLGLASYTPSNHLLGEYRIPYSLIQLGPEGAVLDTIATIDGLAGFRTPRADGPLPFPKNGHLATLGREIVIGDADSLAYERFSGPGIRSQTVSVPGYDLALTSEQRDSTEQVWLHRSDGRPHPPDIVDLLERLPFPTHKPGYTRLLLDGGGYVWAARYYRGMYAGQTVEWEIFAPSGEWLGRIATPAGFDVLQIGSREILGVQRDELEVEHVQVLRLIRSG